MTDRLIKQLNIPSNNVKLPEERPWQEIVNVAPTLEKRVEIFLGKTKDPAGAIIDIYRKSRKERNLLNACQREPNPLR